VNVPSVRHHIRCGTDRPWVVAWKCTMSSPVSVEQPGDCSTETVPRQRSSADRSWFGLWGLVLIVGWSKLTLTVGLICRKLPHTPVAYRSCRRPKCEQVLVTVFTALHVMQTRYSEENSVCPSVCLSVCHTRDPWQNGRKICPDLYTTWKNI